MRARLDEFRVAPGEPWQRRVVVLLAVAAAIEAVDRGSLGALAPTLERVFDISNTRFGVVAAAAGLVSGIATLPAGMLVDRCSRTNILAISLVLWAMAMGASALATSFVFLLATRIALGVVVAAAGPATSSLVGDVYPEQQRGEVMGRVRSGELVGLGAGFLLVGALTAVTSWRVVFATLALVSLAFSRFVARTHEPPRVDGGATEEDHEQGEISRRVVAENVEPSATAIVADDPAQLSMWRVVGYAVRVRTNLAVMIAESMGEFFLAGVSTFAVLFASEQYGVSQATAASLVPVAGLGALAGSIFGGRVGDRLVTRHRLVTGNLWVAAASYLLTASMIVPATLVHSVGIALVLLTAGAVGLGAASPTLDAVRIDVVVSALRGRVEGVRTLCRGIAVAGAPLVIGVMSDNLGGGGRRGLQLTFEVLTPLLAVNAGLVMVASRWFSNDVAAVVASGP